MKAIGGVHRRSLLVAVAAGVLAGAVVHSALKTPWLPLLVHEPGEIDWLNATSGFERFAMVLKYSLLIAAIYSPLLIGLAAIADRKAPRSHLLWLLLGIAGVLPLAILAWFLANDPFDCFTNCEPSWFRGIVAIGPVLFAGAAGAWTTSLIRYAGQRKTA